MGPYPKRPSAATDPGHAGGRLPGSFLLAGRRRDPRPLDPLGAALGGTGEAVAVFADLERGAGRALLLARRVTRGYRALVAGVEARVSMRRGPCPSMQDQVSGKGDGFIS